MGYAWLVLNTDECFVITSSIVITMEFPGEGARRPDGSGSGEMILPNLLNDLSLLKVSFCNPVPAAELKRPKEFDKININKTKPKWKLLIL